MKVSVIKENLAKALQAAGRAVSTKGSLEILSHVMLSTESGRLKISATNLEVGINYWIGAKIEKEGSITVPARLLADIVSSLSSEKIELTLEEQTLNIKAGNDSLTVKGVPADEFPLIPSIEDKAALTIKAEDLRESLNLVTFAAALDEARPVLSGVYIKTEEKKLILAATDSYRLAEKTLELEKEVQKPIEVIVPGRTMIELSRILSDITENIVVSVNDNQILFAANDVEFTSRLIEGQFPNYKQIIPEDNDTKALVSKNSFLNVLKVATLFARETGNSININIKKNKLEVTATSSQLGDSDSIIDAEVDGKDGEIAFNGRYIIDVLNNLKEDKVIFEMSGKLNPGVIRPEKTKNYVYIIMPLRS